MLNRSSLITLVLLLISGCLSTANWFWRPMAQAAAQAQQPADCSLPLFTRQQTIREDARAVNAGDFNLDGKPDLVLLTNDSLPSFLLYFGDGTGSFTPGPIIQLETRPLLTRVANFDGREFSQPAILTIARDESRNRYQLVVWGRLGNGPFSMAPPLDLPPLFNPETMQLELADLNSDARPDVVIAQGSMVQVYLAGVSPALHLADESEWPMNARFALGDVNIDGTPDLVIAQNEPGQVWLALGHGDGTFGARTLLYRAQSRVASVAVADFANTGARDLLITTAARNYAQVSERAPDSFQLQLLRRATTANAYAVISSANFPEPFGYQITRLLDFNADGRLDIAVGNRRFDATQNLLIETDLFWVANNGGAFCALARVPVSANAISVDANLDGRLDFLGSTVGSVNGLSKLFPTVFLNQRNGLVAPPRVIANPNVRLNLGFTPPVTLSTALAQVSDASTPANRLRAEIVQAPDDLQVRDLRVYEDGQLGAVLRMACSVAVPPAFRLRIRVTNEAGLNTEADVMVTPYTGVALLGTENDRRIEIREGVPARVAVIPAFTGGSSSGASGDVYELNYFASGTATIQAFLDQQPLSRTFNNSSGSTAFYYLHARAGEHTLRFVLTGGCNNATTTHEVPVTVIGATTNCVYPSLAAPRVYEANTNLSALAVGDFNGDKRTDVVVSDATNRQLKTYLSQSDGETMRLASTLALASATAYLRVADFNLDGKADLALDQQGLAIYLGSGDGRFALLRKYAGSFADLATGDFNNDGATDLAALSSNVLALLNDRQGNFNIPPEPLGRSGQYMVVTDIQGNAPGVRTDTLDILTSQVFPSSRFRVFTGDGTGRFASASDSIGGSENYGRRVFSDDFDGDGRLDYAVNFGGYDVGRTLDEDLLYLWSRNFTAKYFDLRVEALAAGDLNRDGKPDVVLDNGRVLTSGSPGPFCQMPWLVPVGVPHLGDVNGDGKPDVVMLTANNFQVLLNQSAEQVRPLGTISATFSGDTLAPEQLAATFGVALTTQTQSAARLPLPTTLAGTQVRLRDSNSVEHVAPLLYVSPGQINFQVPAGMAHGLAQIQVTTASGGLAQGAVVIRPVAPGLFRNESFGAGYALRVLSVGTQRIESLFRLPTDGGGLLPAPIDLSNPNEQVFLILFGTGWRGRTALNQVTAIIGGITCETLYAGAQGSLVGLDQVNIRLPLSLAGRGDVDVMLTVEGKAANAVRVNFK